jgi:hypothetical protein
MPQLVHDARANGHGWVEIARALGTNPAEARLRFDPESPIADGRWPYEHRTDGAAANTSSWLGQQRREFGSGHGNFEWPLWMAE